MKMLKSCVKTWLRHALQWRLNMLPVNAKQADYWAGVIRRYPAIFNDIQLHRRQIKLNNGLHMELGLLDLIERQLRTRGEWEPEVGKAIQNLLKPGDIFVDIGANIGYFTLLAAQQVGPHGRVFAFEPALGTLAQLAKHIKLNGFENTLVGSLGISDHHALATLNIAHAHNNGQTSLQPITVARGQQPTLIAPLDALLPSSTPVTLIKLDIEGGEADALRGMQHLLAAQRPAIICELIDPMNAQCQTVQALLAEYGYQLYDLQTGQVFTPQTGVGNVDILCRHTAG